MQKRIKIILISFIFLVSLYGCSAQKSKIEEPFPSRFDSDFIANIGKLQISGHITKNETGIYTFSLTAPETLSGLEISCIGDKVSSNINGVGFESQASDLPASSFIKSVTSALDTLCKAGSVSVTRTDGFNKYSASSQSSAFYALTEQDTGSITSLVIESADISMNFTNFIKT